MSSGSVKSRTLLNREAVWSARALHDSSLSTRMPPNFQPEQFGYTVACITVGKYNIEQCYKLPVVKSVQMVTQSTMN